MLHIPTLIDFDLHVLDLRILRLRDGLDLRFCLRPQQLALLAELRLRLGVPLRQRIGGQLCDLQLGVAGLELQLCDLGLQLGVAGLELHPCELGLQLGVAGLELQPCELGLQLVRD